MSELRPVAIEELLGREPSEPIPELLQAAVQGEAVLVPVLADVADRPRMEMLLRRMGFAVVGSMEKPPTIPRAD